MNLKISLILFLLFFITASLFSQDLDREQNVKMDSLITALKNAKEDTVRCTILNTMIEAEPDDNIWPQYNEQLKTLCKLNLKKHGNGDPLHVFFLKYLASSINNDGYLANIQGDITKALRYYEEGLALDQKSGNLQGVATSLNNIGSIHQYQGDVKKALEYYQKSLILRTELNDKLGISESYNNIGLVYNEQGNIPGALNNYHKGLKIQEEIGDKKGIATSLNNMGELYQQQGDTSRALNYYNKSLKLQEEIGDKNGLAGSLHNIGHIYYERGDIKSALNYFNKSYKISEEIGSKVGMAHCLNSIGVIYSGTNDLSKASEYWWKSLKLREELGDKQGMSLSLNQIATALFKLGKINEAKTYAEQSLKLAQELGYPGDIKTSSGSLSRIYSKAGDWKKAYEMLDLFRQMSDSVSNENSRRITLQKSLQYEYEKKAVADSIKTTSQLKIFDAQIQQQKTQRNALYIGIGLITLFAFFMYNRFKVTQKQKQIIELKEKETQLQKYVIEEKHKEINDSINYAERIQRSFLATEELLSAYLHDYFVLFKPKAIVSGDFYWGAAIRPINSNQPDNFILVTADSTGHGVPGAIMSLLNITSLEKAIEHETEPAAILNHTRKTIIDRLKKDGSVDGGKDGMDCSLIYFDFKNNQLMYAAANNAIWLVRQNGSAKELIELTPDKMPVGKHDKDTISFSQHTVQLQKGDLIYTFTDGIPDQFGGAKGKKFMYKQLKELIVNISDLSLQEQKKSIESSLNNWKGDLEQVDDITLIGLKI